MDIAEFLLAQVAQEERGARRALASPSDDGRWVVRCEHTDREYGDDPYDACVADGHPDCERIEGTGIEIYPEGGHTAAQARHIARWDPARVLAECEAKRRIVKGWHDSFGQWSAPQAEAARAERFRVLRLLAQPYADHPDFDPAWRLS